MKRFVILIISLVTGAGLSAQGVYSLQQCIDSALAHNTGVRRAYLSTERSRVDWKQSKMNLLPDLNADIVHSRNLGRSIDPFTNTYVNQSINAANYSINSGVVLFNGFSLQNILRQNATTYDATRMEWQQARDNMVIDVIAAYLQVLNDEDAVQVSISQRQTSQAMFDRASVLDKQGANRPSDVSDLKGQLMNDQIILLNAKAALESSKLNLSVLMNRPYDSTLRIERINVAEFLAPYSGTAIEVYESALAKFSQVKAVELRSKSAEYAVKAAKGAMFPTVNLGGGINSNYSSIAENAGGKISYTDQLQNNRFTSFGLGISIPIFNNSFFRNRVKLADINLKDVQLIEENTKLQLRQEIDQAYLDMTNAFQRYKLLLDQVAAYQESLKAAEVRYNAGVGTSIDYLTAKDRFDRANISLVNARYLFVLRKRILDYYKGGQ